MTQAIQLFIQRRVIGRVLVSGKATMLGALPSIVRYLPFLPRIPGYLVGVGLRPEHVPAGDAAS